MAVGQVKGDECGPWRRGLDCNFSEDLFLELTGVVMLITAGTFIWKACRRSTAGHLPGSAARRCLLLGAASSVCYALDGLSAAVLPDPIAAPTYPYRVGTAMTLATILPVFMLRTFVRLWVTVTRSLIELSKASAASGECSGGAGGRHGLALRCIACAYDFWAFVHVPAAAVMTCSRYSWGPSFDIVILCWIGWSILTAVCLNSVLAVLMWHVVRQALGSFQRAASLRRVTLVNLLEQVLYNLIFTTTIALYMPDAYHSYGAVQAGVYVGVFLLAWLVHAQVLLFFTVCDPNDPLYSDQGLQALVEEAACPDPGAAALPASVLGCQAMAGAPSV